MSNSQTRMELIAARQRADGARQRFTAALQIARQRISPASLKEDAVETIHQKTNQAKRRTRSILRRHPVLATVAATGTVALLFWKPVRFMLLYGMRGAWLIWLNRALWSLRDDK